jgi:hypothetical protein
MTSPAWIASRRNAYWVILWFLLRVLDVVVAGGVIAAVVWGLIKV